MRVANWSPEVFDELKNIAYARLLEAAYVVKDANVRRLRGQIGTGKTTGINRAVYQRGVAKGEKWTGREFGRLLKSVRVVEKKEKETGRTLWEYKNIRVYAGNKLAYYADIFEFFKPFMRPAFNESLSEVKRIMGAE